MKISSYQFRRFVIVSFFVAWTNAFCFALPTGGNFEAGSGSIDAPDASTLNIHISDGAALNFDSFNINTGETVNVYQPNTSSSALFRDRSGSASFIGGNLYANGELFLINTKGIQFSPTANIATRNFIASTLDINTNNFINKNYQLLNNGNHSEILNQGKIKAENVALIAGSVKNAGVITATMGRATLASGDKVTVSADTTGLIQIEINDQTSGHVIDLENGSTVKDAVVNTGRIEGHEVLMSADTAEDIFDNSINSSGIVKVNATATEDGVIRLRANHDIQVSGTLEADRGIVNISSQANIKIPAALETTGTTTLAANNNIIIDANLIVRAGPRPALEGGATTLAILADNDFDGHGAIQMAPGTTIATIVRSGPAMAGPIGANGPGNPAPTITGDIFIQSAGPSQLSNITSAGNLTLVSAGAMAVYTQAPNSVVDVAGSVVIDIVRAGPRPALLGGNANGQGDEGDNGRVWDPPVRISPTINATNTKYYIGRDWINTGQFNGDTSAVICSRPH